MSSPLQGSLAKQIGKAMSGLFYDATLSRSETTGGDPFDPGSGTTTTVDYACKAIEDSYSLFEQQNTLIQAGDVKVIVLATTLAVTPVTSDKITTRGVTRSIVNISTDPARAAWVLQARS